MKQLMFYCFPWIQLKFEIMKLSRFSWKKKVQIFKKKHAKRGRGGIYAVFVKQFNFGFIKRNAERKGNSFKLSDSK